MCSNKTASPETSHSDWLDRLQQLRIAMQSALEEADALDLPMVGIRLEEALDAWNNAAAKNSGA